MAGEIETIRFDPDTTVNTRCGMLQAREGVVRHLPNVGSIPSILSRFNTKAFADVMLLTIS